MENLNIRFFFKLNATFLLISDHDEDWGFYDYFYYFLLPAKINEIIIQQIDFDKLIEQTYISRTSIFFYFSHPFYWRIFIIFYLDT